MQYRFASPRAGGAFDPIEIVTGRLVPAGWRFRGRGHAHSGDAPPRPIEPGERMDVVVAVDQEFGTMPRQHVAQARRIDEPFEMSRARAPWRVMDEDDAKRIAEPIKVVSKPPQLS